MKAKKIISLMLVVFTLFSFCSLSSYAADGNATYQLKTSDLSLKCTVQNNDLFSDITSEITVGTFVFSDGNKYTRFGIPKTYYIDGHNFNLTLSLSNPFTIRAEHEYNVTLAFQQTYNLAAEFVTYVNIYNSNGSLFKQKAVFADTSSYTKRSLDFNFSFSKSELPDGYYCRFVFQINQQTFGVNNSKVDNAFSISEYITITDLDDDSGWFQKIINAITSIPEKIGNFFSNLGESISNWFSELLSNLKTQFQNIGKWFSELGDKIGQFFVNLGEDIKEFFTMLKNYLLYFQHPVTLNSDGVLVGKDGKPVYTNPFDSAIETVRSKIYEWIDNIDSFIEGMDESRENVSGYLEKGSSFINGIMKASPILTACVLFAVGFYVIRKVVGR